MPSRSRHRILGARQRWTEKAGRYRIERFPEDGAPTYIILVATDHWRPLGHRRTLKAAKGLANKHHRSRPAGLRMHD